MFSCTSRLLFRCSSTTLRRVPLDKCLTKSRAMPGLSSPVLRHRRPMSTPAPQVNESHISMEQYHTLSDSTMDTLLDSLEFLLDGAGRPDYEVEYHSGVLTLKLGDNGTYVINKQPPNKQIWLSSPFSGPKRYDYSEADDDWLYSRDGRALGDLLNDELSEVLEQKVDLGLSGVSSKLD